MTEFAEMEMRHMCRNPRCRSKLPEPVSNPREAFCARGCHTSFYLHRCIVCEEPIERRTANQKICKKSRCRSAFRAGNGFGRYLDTPAVEQPPKTSIKPGIKSGLKGDRAPPWRVVAAGAPISANQYHCAIVGAEEAIAAADRINAAHWRAAKAGERGYRLADAPVIESKSQSATAITRAHLAIPADLSIPAFLDCRPLPLQRAA
jgi:hypothetical protein